jgi:acyl carrier protein
MPYVAPQTPTERMLAELWAELLNLDRVGIHDGFLELGGDSLQAARVAARLRKLLNIELSSSRLLEATTICIMAEMIAHQVLNEAPPRHLDLLLGEIEALSEDEASLLLDPPGAAAQRSDRC